MLTAGNQVVVWLTDDGARQFLGLDRPDDQRSRWAFFGKVADEPKVLGLWLTLERIEERELGTEAKVKKNWVVTPRTCMIRFDFILVVQYFDTDNPKEALGFKMNLP
jgi:hypothetical protein